VARWRGGEATEADAERSLAKPFKAVGAATLHMFGHPGVLFRIQGLEKVQLVYFF